MGLEKGGGNDVTHWEMTIKHRDIELIKKIINVMLKIDAYEFEFEKQWEKTGNVYYLTINTCWGNNIDAISKVIKKYEKQKFGD